MSVCLSLCRFCLNCFFSFYQTSVKLGLNDAGVRGCKVTERIWNICINQAKQAAYTLNVSSPSVLIKFRLNLVPGVNDVMAVGYKVTGQIFNICSDYANRHLYSPRMVVIKEKSKQKKQQVRYVKCDNVQYNKPNAN